MLDTAYTIGVVLASASAGFFLGAGLTGMLSAGKAEDQAETIRDLERACAALRRQNEAHEAEKYERRQELADAAQRRTGQRGKRVAG